jgi:hypothetical protein
MNTKHSIIAFPTFVSALGGAKTVRLGIRFAWIEKADGVVVKVKRSMIPANSEQNAFKLADIADTAQERN